MKSIAKMLGKFAVLVALESLIWHSIDLLQHQNHIFLIYFRTSNHHCFFIFLDSKMCAFFIVKTEKWNALNFKNIVTKKVKCFPTCYVKHNSKKFMSLLYFKTITLFFLLWNKPVRKSPHKFTKISWNYIDIYYQK